MMPSFSNMFFIVAPLHGPSIVGMQKMRVRKPAFGQYTRPGHDARQFRALAHMNFPAHDFPAEEIHDQMEVENMPATGPAIQVMSHVQTPQDALA